VTSLVVFSTLTLCSADGEAFGPGEAAKGSNARPHADYKVLIWYRKTDSLGTFKYETYDLRKGEYTAAVDEWIKDVRVNYPAYYVAVREVDLARENGNTERLKLGSVINRELVAAAAAAGIMIAPGQIHSRPLDYGVFRGAPAASSRRDSGPGRLPSSFRVDRGYLNQSTTPYPIPVPLLSRPR
jgi:hypothetical protein